MYPIPGFEQFKSSGATSGYGNTAQQSFIDEIDWAKKAARTKARLAGAQLEAETVRARASAEAGARIFGSVAGAVGDIASSAATAYGKWKNDQNNSSSPPPQQWTPPPPGDPYAPPPYNPQGPPPPPPSYDYSGWGW